jgi:protein-glutamine gamma-glutamyltransferase
MATTSQVRHELDPLRQGVERYYEYSLFAMIVTGFVTLAGTGKLDPAAMLVVFAALGLRAYLLATRRKLTLTVKTTTRLTIAYIFFYVADFFLLSRSFITATVHLVLFIMVVKMFSMERQRDDVYLAVISFLMILASAILTVDSFFFAAFSLFLLLTVTTFVTMEMRRSYREMEKPRKTDKSSPDAPMAARALGIHVATAGLTPTQRLARSLSSSAVVLVITIVLGAVAVFFILPRVSSGYLSRFASRNAYVSGFGDNVQLGEIGRIQQSDDVVMHVQFPPRTAVPSDLKFRGVALDHFDGRRWMSTQWTQQVRNSSINFQVSGLHTYLTGLENWPRSANSQTINYRVMLQPLGTSYFFLIQTPVQLTSDIRFYGIERNGGVTSQDPTRLIRIYAGRSELRTPDPTLAIPFPESSPEGFQPYLALPPMDPRIAKLAEEVTRNQGTPLAKAAALELFLQNNFQYSLQMFTAEGAEPLAYFLFNRKQGHCEYFASSMAVMLRTLGIPSRIVNGFRNGELNDITGSYVVRARNAHSWVEAYIPGYGWATFDPTPASGLEAAPTTYSRMLLYVDAMREFWSEWIINYDFTHQNNLSTSTVSSARQLFDSSRIYLRERYEELLKKLKRTETAAISEPRRLGIRIVAVLVALLLLVNTRRIMRFWRERRLAASPDKAPRMAASVWYERLLRLLRRRGMEKRPSQTSAEFIESIPDRRVKASVAGFTGHYERARFGGSSESAAKLPELYEEVEEVLKQ